MLSIIVANELGTLVGRVINGIKPLLYMETIILNGMYVYKYGIQHIW